MMESTKRKKHIKISIDILMSILLMFLLAYQVTGSEYHEWIGAGMVILFLLHNTLNYRWYQGLFKGSWNRVRIVHTLINFAVFIAMILTAYSGIVMSRYVFAFLPIESKMATARRLHMAGSYWSFVLMGLHLGCHWNMVTHHWKKRSKVINLVLLVVGCLIAIYGLIEFINGGIYANMLLLNEFAMLDFETPAPMVIIKNITMFGTWVFVGHFLMRVLRGKNMMSLKV